MKLKKYRIVPDNFLGCEVQCWRLWWPFWKQLGFVNTHSSVDKAKKWLIDTKFGIPIDVNKLKDDIYAKRNNTRHA